MKNLISSLTEKPNPEIQILGDLFTYSRLRPNKYVEPEIIIRIHTEHAETLWNTQAIYTAKTNPVKGLGCHNIYINVGIKGITSFSTGLMDSMIREIWCNIFVS